MVGERLGGSGPDDGGERDFRGEIEELTERSAEIREKTKEAFGDDLSPMPYLSYFGEKAFSGDGATLFMLVNLEEKPTLVKVGWGEFSADLFTPGAEVYGYKQDDNSWHSDKFKQHKRVLVELLRNFPLPLYCVSQRNSWLAEEEDKELMLDDPAEYLKRNAIFCAKNGEVTIAERLTDKIINGEGTREELKGLFGRGKRTRLDYPVEPVEEQEVLDALETTRQKRENLENSY